MWLHWKYNKVFIWKVIINKWNYTSYLSSVPCSCGFFVLIFQLNFVKKCANASNIPWQYFKYHEWLCGTLKLNFLVNYIFVLQKLWIWRPFLKFCLYYLFGLYKWLRCMVLFGNLLKIKGLGEKNNCLFVCSTSFFAFSRCTLHIFYAFGHIFKFFIPSF